MITSEDVALVVDRCQALPPAKEVYLEDDFVLNLLETVVDYMMRTTAVIAALRHFREQRWNEIRTLEDLEDLFTRYSDDQQGNTALAQYLWGYSLWTRARQLRDLAAYFRSIGVVDQDRLRDWARASEFRRDFEGRVKGLGIAVYHWLVMRQGVDTVKPDVHVRRFAESALGRSLSDTEVIEVVVGAARSLGVKAFELDWRIWEFQQSA